jgi:spore germination protein YaaH
MLYSCREAVKLKSSVRKTETEARLFKNTMSKIEKGFGLDKLNKSKDLAASDTSIYAPRSQKSMLNQYGYIYDALSSNENPVSSSNFKYDTSTSEYRVVDTTYRAIENGKEVFGWHPYWMGDSWKQYPFDLLTTIAYFSYKVDPLTGSYTNPKQIEAWNTTKMIDTALMHHTKVLLTVSCHGSTNTASFLDNPDRWSTLIETISPLLISRNANGLDINFESLSYFKREKFNKFIAQLDQELTTNFEKEEKKFFLSITLPAVNSRDVFDVQELDKYADLMTIMGYDYNTGNQVQGPVAPLRSKESSISLSTTLDYYLSRGINPNKTVLALPYYGSMWDGNLVEEGTSTYNATKLERKVTYSEVKKLLIDNKRYNTVPILDEYSMTNYYNLTYSDNTTKEIWYDDAYTLGKKYDYAMSKDLKGVGIWALGYDNGYKDLWKVIEDRFSTDVQVYKNPIAAAEGYPVQFSRFLLKYSNLFIMAAILFFIAVCLGFVLLLTDWKVRENILKHKLYQWVFLILAIIFILPTTAMVYKGLNELLPYFNLFIKPEWQIYLAFIIGMITFYLIQKLKIKSIERP